MDVLPTDLIERRVDEALAEDLGEGDATSTAIIPEGMCSKARMVARESLVVAGLDLAEAAFRRVSPQTIVRRRTQDGRAEPAGALLLEVEGPTRALLGAERVALNFVQRLSGIATLTARFVDAVRHTGASILDTRKTTPGWRLFEKHAVKCGGGQNHRFGLYDLILIKDNHLAALMDASPNPIAAAVNRARQAYPQLQVEVEADNLEQVRQAVEAGADIVLLDNMPPDRLRRAVEIVDGRCRTEASGGITLDTVVAVAESGVDCISVGALTHSPPSADIGLDFDS